MKTIQQIKNHFARDWSDAKMNVAYTERNPYFEFFLMIIYWGYIYHYCFAIPLCKLKGHDWEDEGHATPDSGCIDMVCKRCGYSPGIIHLY